MSALSDLRRLLLDKASGPDTTGTVVEVQPGGRVLVRTARRTVACTTVVPVAVGEDVRVQGSLIVARQVAASATLPMYRV